MSYYRPARDHLTRLAQLGALARVGATEPRVQAAVAALGDADATWQAEAIGRALAGFRYVPDHGDKLPSVAAVLDAGGDDCDGLTILAAALGLAAGLPVQIQLFRGPWDHDATHVAAVIAGVLVDPTPQPLLPWQPTGPGPLELQPLATPTHGWFVQRGVA